MLLLSIVLGLRSTACGGILLVYVHFMVSLRVLFLFFLFFFFFFYAPQTEFQRVDVLDP